MAVSKTDLFKEHIQKIIEDSLGVKVSKVKAYELFKDIFYGIIDFVIEDSENNVSLIGLGKFQIYKSVPKMSKAGLDKNGNPTGEKAWDFVPRFKFRESAKVAEQLAKHYGFISGESGIPKVGIFKEEE